MKNLKQILRISAFSLALLSSPIYTNTFAAKKPQSLIDVLMQENKDQEEYKTSKEVLELEKQLADYLKNVIEPKIKELEVRKTRMSSYQDSFSQLRNTFEKKGLITTASIEAQSLESRLTKEDFKDANDLLKEVSAYKTKVAAAVKETDSMEKILANWLSSYENIKTKVRAENYNSALEQIDKLIVAVEKISSKYDAEISYRLKQSARDGKQPNAYLTVLKRNNFISSQDLLIQLKSYRQTPIIKEIDKIKQTIQQGYSLVKSFDSIIKRNNADELLELDSKCRSLKNALSKKPYESETELKKKVETYGTSVHSRLVLLKKQKMDYLRREFKRMESLINSRNIEEGKRLNYKLQKEAEAFKRSALSSNRF